MGQVSKEVKVRFSKGSKEKKIEKKGMVWREENIGE